MTKTFRLAALLAMAPVIAQASSVPAQARDLPATASAPQRLAPLAGAQGRILAAAQKALTSKDYAGFGRVESEISGVNVGNAQELYYKNYWLAFSHYQKAIALMRANQKENARGSLDRSLALLKAIPNKDVEVNALLGLASGLNLAFIPRQRIVIAAQESGSYVAAGLASGRPSPRAFYASAIADWNTPSMYGGTLKAEGLAKKAIALNEPASQLRPTWGRDEATALLIRIYVAQKRTPEARALLETARRQFPGSLAISEVSSQV